jgi:hypothetical protein
MKKIYLLLIILLTAGINKIYADVIVIPASGGTDLAPVSPNVTDGWALLGDIMIMETRADDIDEGQTNALLILSAPENWRFQTNEGKLSTQGDLDDPGFFPSFINVSSAYIYIIFSTDGSGNSGKNEIDVITISGIKVQPVNPEEIPSFGHILRTGGDAEIKGARVRDDINYGDLSLDVNNPLPVELSSFTVLVRNNSVYLEWGTETETDNYGFDVERSVDEINWKKVSFIRGHGNSNSPKVYNFTDNPGTGGKYFFRLKQIDNNGAFEYSKIIEAYIDIPSVFELSQNYPNPFNPETKIKFVFNNKIHAELKVFDITGSEAANLFTGITEPDKIYEVTFDGSEFSSGIYYYRLTGAGNTEVKKMILLK